MGCVIMPDHILGIDDKRLPDLETKIQYTHGH